MGFWAKIWFLKKKKTEEKPPEILTVAAEMTSGEDTGLRKKKNSPEIAATATARNLECRRS